MQCLSCQWREQLDASPDGFRLQCVTERQAQTKSSELDSALLQIYAVHFPKQRLQNADARRFPMVAASPMQDQSLIGFHQKYARSAGGIENDLVARHNSVKSFPAERLVEHEPNKKRGRINGGTRIFNKELVNMADEFYW